MPRQRYQRGMVEKTKTKPVKWNGRYAVYVIENGAEKRKTKETILGLASEMSKSDAEEKLHDIIQEETHAPNSGEMTLWQFMQRPEKGYIALRSPSWRPKWKNVAASLYKCHFQKTISAKRLKDIGRVDCQAWLNTKKVLSASMIHKCFTQLFAILEEACAQDLTKKNRAIGLTVPESEKPVVEPPPLSKDQVVLGLKITSRYKSQQE
ncbi:MAG: hypothetical protein WB992_13325 [Bryobacteraceae bacterium]